MSMKKKLLLLAAAGLAALVLVTYGVAALVSVSPANAAQSVVDTLNFQDDDEDAGEVEQPISGDALERAAAAALAHTGAGRVTDTEVGDEEGYYEVEVTLEDGSQVDVHLDENFNVIGQESENGDPEQDEDFAPRSQAGDDEDEQEDDTDTGEADEDDPISGSISVNAGTSDLQSLARLTAAEAEAIALQAYPGTGLAEETELEVENGFLVYEVELDNGMEVIIDAGSEEILHRELDD